MIPENRDQMQETNKLKVGSIIIKVFVKYQK